jgi:hypothetical protein
VTEGLSLGTNRESEVLATYSQLILGLWMPMDMTFSAFGDDAARCPDLRPTAERAKCFVVLGGLRGIADPANAAGRERCWPTRNAFR